MSGTVATALGTWLWLLLHKDGTPLSLLCHQLLISSPGIDVSDWWSHGHVQPPNVRENGKSRLWSFIFVQWGILQPNRKRLHVPDDKELQMSMTGLLLWVHYSVNMCLQGRGNTDHGEISGKNIKFRKYGVLIIFCLFSAPFLPSQDLLCITGLGPCRPQTPCPLGIFSQGEGLGGS